MRNETEQQASIHIAFYSSQMAAPGMFLSKTV